jgi:hypothetical protein
VHRFDGRPHPRVAGIVDLLGDGVPTGSRHHRARRSDRGFAPRGDVSRT